MSNFSKVNVPMKLFREPNTLETCEIQLDLQHGEIAHTSLQILIIRILCNDDRTLNLVDFQQFSHLRLTQ